MSGEVGVVSGLFSSESEVAGRRPNSFSTNPRSVRRHRISRPVAIVQLHRGRSLNRLFWLGAGTLRKPPLFSPPVRLPHRRRAPRANPSIRRAGAQSGSPSRTPGHRPGLQPPAGPATTGRASPIYRGRDACWRRRSASS